MDAVVGKTSFVEVQESRVALAETRKTLGKVTRAKSKDQATRSQILELLERQQYRCALSGDALSPDDAELDHVVPVTKGGDNSINNIQIVTKRINRMKGAMTNEQFVAACCRVAACHPSHP